MTIPEKITEAISEQLLADEARRGGPWTTPRTYVYASARRSCVRRMALDLLEPRVALSYTGKPSALASLRRGNDREEDMLSYIAKAGESRGFRLVEQQKRFEIRDRDGRLLIVGKVDAVVEFSDRSRALLEVKSGRSYQNCRTPEDLDGGMFTAHALDQLLCYQYAESVSTGKVTPGFFVIDTGSLPHFIGVDLEQNLGRVEGFMRDARTAIDAAGAAMAIDVGEREDFDGHLYGSALPPYATRPSLCRLCPHHGVTCEPPAAAAGQVEVIADEGLIELAIEREKHAEAAKAFVRADKALKAELRGKELALLGPFEVVGKWTKRSEIVVPLEIEKQIEGLRTDYGQRVTNEHGAYSLALTRIVDDARGKAATSEDTV